CTGYCTLCILFCTFCSLTLSFLLAGSSSCATAFKAATAFLTSFVQTQCFFVVFTLLVLSSLNDVLGRCCHLGKLHTESFLFFICRVRAACGVMFCCFLLILFLVVLLCPF